jgi:hypothetical protein
MSTLRRATVTRVTDTGLWCTIATIGGPDHEWGPLERPPLSIDAGDRIIVGQVSSEFESFVVLAPLKEYIGNQKTIYYFEDEAARDAMFPEPTIPSPTFVWIDDLGDLQVWTDEVSEWVTVSWDESRIIDIETDILDLAAADVAIDTRLDALESPVFNVTDTATVDLSYNSGTRNLQANVVANSISLDNLSDVTTGATALGQVIRHNGTTFVNSAPLLNDPSDVVLTSPTATQVLRYSGTQWENKPTDIHLCTSITRPVSPATNQIILETDTGRYYMWDGTVWWWPHPRGLIAGKMYNSAVLNTFLTNGGAAEYASAINLASFVWEQRRLFRIVAKVRILTASGGDTVSIIRIREGTSGTAGAIRGYEADDFGTNMAIMSKTVHHWYETGSSDETKSLVVTFEATTGTMNSYYGHVASGMQVGLFVFDDGPSGRITTVSV